MEHSKGLLLHSFVDPPLTGRPDGGKCCPEGEKQPTSRCLPAARLARTSSLMTSGSSGSLLKGSPTTT